MATDNEELQTQILPLVVELLAPTPAYFLVDVVVRGRYGATRKVDVLIDGDEGIGIDEVVAISRALSEKLDELDIVKGAFNLEVGSPGIDHPLINARQFAKNLGRGLKVDLPDGTSQIGTLKAADTDTFTFVADAPKGTKRSDPAQPDQIFAYSAIKAAIVQVKF